MMRTIIQWLSASTRALLLMMIGVAWVALQVWLAIASSQAREICNDYTLGPGRESFEVEGSTFIVYTDKATKPVGLNCRPRLPSVRAADGTPGAASCALL